MSGQIDIGEQGMGYLDLNPTLGGNDGYVTVHLQRPDDNVQAQLALYQYADPGNHALGFIACGAPVEFVFANGEATAAVPIVGSCYLATLFMVRSGPTSIWNVFGSHISWSATATVSIGLAPPIVPTAGFLTGLGAVGLTAVIERPLPSSYGSRMGTMSRDGPSIRDSKSPIVAAIACGPSSVVLGAIHADSIRANASVEESCPREYLLDSALRQVIGFYVSPTQRQ